MHVSKEHKGKRPQANHHQLVPSPNFLGQPDSKIFQTCAALPPTFPPSLNVQN